MVALFGGNGAGKTTLLRAISRLIDVAAGRIRFAGRDVAELEAHQLPELGLTHVPEGRHVFPQMTVQEISSSARTRPGCGAGRPSAWRTSTSCFPC